MCPGGLGGGVVEVGDEGPPVLGMQEGGGGREGRGGRAGDGGGVEWVGCGG